LARNDYGRQRTREEEAENNGGCSDTESHAASVHQAMMRLAVAAPQVGGSYTASARVLSPDLRVGIQEGVSILAARLAFPRELVVTLCDRSL
jgi:hypothetical protein